MVSGDQLDPASAAEGEVLFYKPPVTSVKGWALYVKGLASNFKRPPFAMVTTMKVVPDAKTQFRVLFKPDGVVPPETLPALIKRHEEIMETIAFPYAEASPDREDKKPKKPTKAKPQPVKGKKF
jgi:hypothetical protein